MVQTLITALAHRPELASLHHPLSLLGDGSSVLALGLLHLEVHGVVWHRRREKLRSVCFSRHCGRRPGNLRTFLCREPPLQPVQDADLGFSAQGGGSLCGLGRGSYVVQLHFAVGEVPQRARHAVKGDDELGAGRVSSVLADATRQRQQLNGILNI